jgi:hypothetical protein
MWAVGFCQICGFDYEFVNHAQPSFAVLWSAKDLESSPVLWVAEGAYSEIPPRVFTAIPFLNPQNSSAVPFASP